MRNTVTIQRINNHEYSFALSTNAGKRIVATALTFDNPNPEAFKKTKSMFDRKNFTFKVGMIFILKRYLSDNNISWECIDYDYEVPSRYESDSRLLGKYNYQSEAVKVFYSKRFGILKVPTRGGKTFIASEIIRVFLSNFDGNVMFVVDTQDLWRQAVEDIKKFFRPYFDINIGEIREGKVDVSHRVTVAMIQTIQSTLSSRCNDRKKKAGLTKYLKELKFLCVDEIHDNCSDSRLKIYKKSKSLEFLLCLSATPYRKEAWDQNLKLQSWSGDIIYTIPEETLRESGVLTEYKVFMLMLDHNETDFLHGDEMGLDFMEYRKRIIFNNPMRDGVLLKVFEILNFYNLKTLVLFQSVEHGRAISAVTGYTFISGVTTSDDRGIAKDYFLEGEGKILLASGIFKKGITLPGAEVMINVDSGLEESGVIQRKGRILGAIENKDRSLVIDFFDVFDDYFSDHSEARLNTYVKEIGEENVGILDTAVDDCFDTLKDWVGKWFRKDKDYSGLQ